MDNGSGRRLGGAKIQMEGRLERAGSTRYEHGSHVLVPLGRRTDVRYVLRGDSGRMRELEGRNVQVTGALVEDAPRQEGAAGLIEVFLARELYEGSDGTLR